MKVKLKNTLHKTQENVNCVAQQENGDRTEYRKNRPVICEGRRKNKTQTHKKKNTSVSSEV